jgi:defect-in-organelle-trafficking protein DotD
VAPFDRFVARLTEQASRMKSGSALVAVVALAGCAVAPAQQPSTSSTGATPPLEVATELSAVANNINAHLQRLAEVKEAGKKVVVPQRPKVTAGPLAARMSILWRSGPAEEIVSKLAADAGYEFRSSGKAPVLPLLVKIDVADEQLIDVLRSIGLQLGDKAMLNVDPSNKLIEVIYASDR